MAETSTRGSHRGARTRRGTTPEGKGTTRQLHDDIAGALRRKLDPRLGSGARVINAFKHGGATVWKQLRRHPFAGMVGLGAAATVAAGAIGVGELAFGVSVAIVVYKVLREGEPPMQAIEEIEHGRA